MMRSLNRRRIAFAAVVFALFAAGCKGNKNLTKANFEKITPGMTLADVQALLGGPGESEGGDLAVAEGSSVGGAVGIGDMQSMSKPRSNSKVYKWGNDSRWIRVTFFGDKVAPENYKSEHGLK